LLAPDIETSRQAIAAAAPCDLRVVALARSSQQVLRQADAWSRMAPARLCAYERMRVWHQSLPPDGLATLVFDAAELSEPELGFIVEQKLLTWACIGSFEAAGGRLINSSLSGLGVDGANARVTTDVGVFHAGLLVGADGARSRVRELLGIALQTHAYNQSAIVANVSTARAHQHTAWQRFLATGPVALLPLFTGQSSIVWTLDEVAARHLMAASPQDFSRRLTEATDSVLGDVTLQSERGCFPLQRATAVRLMAKRTALIGDAAHQIHPLAGQGINLGFLDAAALCESIAMSVSRREDVGSVRTLRHYEQRRLTHDTLMSWSMSAFNALFSQGGAPGWIGARLLALAGSSGPMRRMLARRAMGLDGALPRLAA
jgi:2-octaprenylphenol hydroxylase